MKLNSQKASGLIATAYAMTAVDKLRQQQCQQHHLSRSSLYLIHHPP
jgi:hypothetical protein